MIQNYFVKAIIIYKMLYTFVLAQ